MAGTYERLKESGDFQDLAIFPFQVDFSPISSTEKTSVFHQEERKFNALSNGTYIYF